MENRFGGFGNKAGVGGSGINFGFAKKENLQLTNIEFSEWRDFIYNLTGIYFQENKKYLLENRLQKRVDFLRLDSFKKYMDFLKFNPAKSKELSEFYEVITINETFFFRNQPQLDALVGTIIPEIMNKPENRMKRKFKIWSAASSSGEEAYSVAMMIDDLIKPKYPNVTFEIIGTDINYAVVETARKAIYKEYSIRNTPPYYLKKYFKSDNGTYILDNKIKSMSNFSILNLYDDNAMRKMTEFDVIYCANVLIYFDQQSKIKVVNHLYNSLNRGGYLFIGYSETLHGISKAFKLTSFPKTIGYNKE